MPPTTPPAHDMTAQPEFEACIDALWVFPVKSCAGISLSQAVLTPTGLAWDRAWMVVDAAGEMLTQRELPRMVLIRPELTPTELVLHAAGMAALRLPLQLPPPAAQTQARVWDDVVRAFDMGDAASAWLGACLGHSLGALRLVRFDETQHRLSSAKWTQGRQALNQFSDGFPLLVVSKASLDELNQRLQAQGAPAVDMRRFRANVVLRNAQASPDALSAIAAHDENRIGTMTIVTEGEAVQLHPVKPCPRCPIPNINPDTAQSDPCVNDTLQTYRQDPRVNGALSFGMNCIPLAGLGQVLRVGQRVRAKWVFA